MKKTLSLSLIALLALLLIPAALAVDSIILIANPSVAGVGNPVVLIAEGEYATGEIVTRAQWRITSSDGNVQTLTTNEAELDYEFDEADNYRVDVTVYTNQDTSGASDYAYVMVKETFAPYVFMVCTPQEGAAPFTANFIAYGEEYSSGDEVVKYQINYDSNLNGVYDEENTDGIFIEVYDEPGQYIARVRGIDKYGNIGYATCPINVIEAGVDVVVTSDYTYGTAPLTVQFDSDASTTDGATITSYAWNFGDGATSTEKSPEHEFKTADNYEVKLIVKDSKGRIGETSTYIMVTEGNKAPYASLVAVGETTGAAAPLKVNFVAYGDDSDGKVVKYEINYDSNIDAKYDGVVEFSEGVDTASFSYTYEEKGVYIARLRVTDDKGGLGYATVTVNVASERPVAVIEANTYYALAPATIKFDAGSSTDDGKIVAWAWDLDGDGTVDCTKERCEHTYDTADNYFVTLTVTDEDGLRSETVTEGIIIADNKAPYVAMVPDTYFGYATPTEPLEVTFVVAADDADGTVSYIEIDVNGDGVYDGKEDGSEAVFTHKYEVADNYLVRVRAVDDKGGIGYDTEWILVSADPAPYASMVADTYFGYATPTEPLTVTFEGFAEDNGQIVSYEWDFDGDGAYDAEGQTVSHDYYKADNYLVRLRVKDDKGGYGYDTEWIMVSAAAAPYAKMTADPMKGFAPLEVNFRVVADGQFAIKHIEIDFESDGVYDDKSNGTEAHFTNVYMEEGTYVARARVTDEKGGLGYSTAMIEVDTAAPEIYLEVTASPRNGPAPLRSVFYAEVYDGEGNEIEDFNLEVDFDEDGSVEHFHDNSFENVFDEDGTYNVKVRAFTADASSTPEYVTVKVGYIPPVTDEIEITLNKGWNLISTPLQPENNNVDVVLAGVDYDIAWKLNRAKPSIIGNQWLAGNEAYKPGLYGEFSTIDAGVGYWILVNKPTTLTIKGDLADDKISLKEGVNVVGFNSDKAENIDSALAGVEYSSIRRWTADGYETSVPGVGGEFSSLEPGKGYVIFAKSDQVWG